MSKNKAIVLLLSAFMLAACNFSPTASPVTPTFPIPNQTMTALFSTQLPTIAITKVPGLITATLPGQLPSATQAPAVTATFPPISTATQPAPTEPAPTQPPATKTTVPTQPAPSSTSDTSHRTVISATSSLLSTKPALNGDWNDLPDKEYPAEIVVFGRNAWTNTNDLSASFKTGWDATYLYLGVKVHDNVYAQNATGVNLFKGDSIEVLLDTDVASDFFSTKTSADDFQLGISPGLGGVGGATEAYLWQPSNLAGSRTQVKVVALRSDSAGITRYEVAIPWSVFGVTPKSGKHFGFALSVSDNDSTSSNVQQSMVSNDKNRDLTNPTTWGDLTLK
jgi:hypothetical protein